MRLLLVTCLLAAALATAQARSLAEENPFLRLGSLFGLGGSGNSGGWNPLSLLGMGGGDKKDDQPNAAKHFASIASGVNGIMKDMMKGAAKLGEELSPSEAPPTTTTKDPIVDGIGKLISGFLGRQRNKDSEQKPDIK